MLNNCKKGKSFLSKYAIYRKFQISSFGLTCFAKPRLAYLCSFCSKWVREKKNEGREKDVFKTYLIGTFIRRSDWDVFPCFQFEPNMNVLLWTCFVRTFLVRVSTGDDICKRVIEFKAKNEIIKINRDYNNIDKRITDRQIRSWASCSWVGSLSKKNVAQVD